MGFVAGWWYILDVFPFRDILKFASKEFSHLDPIIFFSRGAICILVSLNSTAARSDVNFIELFLVQEN